MEANEAEESGKLGLDGRIFGDMVRSLVVEAKVSSAVSGAGNPHVDALRLLVA